MSFAPQPPSAESPCINVCVMDGDSGYCLGCRRTLDEIASWGIYSDAQRLAVLARLAGREVPPWEPDA